MVVLRAVPVVVVRAVPVVVVRAVPVVVLRAVPAGCLLPCLLSMFMSFETAAPM